MANKKNEIAEEKAVEEATVEEAPAVKEGPKKVKIKIPLTRTEKDDVYVAVNGKSYQIKRGVEVEVPVGVAAAIKCSDEMLAKAMAFEEEAAEKAKQ